MSILEILGQTRPLLLGDWRIDASCRGIDPTEQDRLFFPRRGEPCIEAKRICFNCPVKTECLDYALRQYIKVGIWGGRSERERRRMRRERREAVRAGLPLPPPSPVDEWPDVYRGTGRRGRPICKCEGCAIERERRRRLLEVAA